MRKTGGRPGDGAGGLGSGQHDKTFPDQATILGIRHLDVEHAEGRAAGDEEGGLHLLHR